MGPNLFLLRHFFLFLFVHHICLEHSSSDKSDESDEEDYDELGSESGSSGTFGTILGALLRGVEFSLGVTLSDAESCDGNGGSLAP